MKLCISTVCSFPLFLHSHFYLIFYKLLFFPQHFYQRHHFSSLQKIKYYCTHIDQGERARISSLHCLSGTSNNRQRSKDFLMD